MAAPAPTVDDYLEAMRRESRSWRLARMGLKVDGQDFDLARYPHLVAIIDDDHPDQVIKKGGQLGLTVSAVLKAIDRAHQAMLSGRRQRGTLYLFPRDDDVGDFSRARFQPILNENPELAALVGSTESIGIKQIGGSFFYFRGAGAKEAATQGSRAKLKSMPIDDLIFDERDDMPDSRVVLADRRLDGAVPPNKHRTELGTPTIPGYGVDERFERSDQHHWHYRCARCGGWGCLELEWPDCLATRDESAFYRCVKCKKPLEVEYHRWVPAYPGREDVRGRYVSQLHSPTRTPLSIATEWDDAVRKGGAKLREFYNHTLGLGYADEDDALTRAIVLAACTPDPRQPSSEGPCALGADVGPGKIHYEVREKLSDDGRRSRVVQWGEVADFEELDAVYRKFNVACAVIDAMAETRAVRDFLKRHPGQAFGCFYSPAQKAETVWNVPDQTVTVNRTESLDASHAEIVAGEVELPRPDDLFEKEVLPQLLNVARIVQTDEETGARRAKWIVRGAKNDHLRHAHNYARIALGRVGLAERLSRIRRRSATSPSRPRGFMGR